MLSVLPRVSLFFFLMMALQFREHINTVTLYDCAHCYYLFHIIVITFDAIMLYNHVIDI